MTQYVAHFTDGGVAPVRIRGECQDFKIGIAVREDGYARCVFIGNGQHQSDPWIERITSLEAPAAAA